jgi:hypothetical protein
MYHLSHTLVELSSEQHGGQQTLLSILGNLLAQQLDDDSHCAPYRIDNTAGLNILLAFSY